MLIDDHNDPVRIAANSFNLLLGPKINMRYKLEYWPVNQHGENIDGLFDYEIYCRDLRVIETLRQDLFLHTGIYPKNLEELVVSVAQWSSFRGREVRSFKIWYKHLSAMFSVNDIEKYLEKKTRNKKRVCNNVMDRDVYEFIVECNCTTRLYNVIATHTNSGASHIKVRRFFNDGPTFRGVGTKTWKEFQSLVEAHIIEDP